LMSAPSTVHSQPYNRKYQRTAYDWQGGFPPVATLHQPRTSSFDGQQGTNPVGGGTTINQPLSLGQNQPLGTSSTSSSSTAGTKVTRIWECPLCHLVNHTDQIFCAQCGSIWASRFEGNMKVKEEKVGTTATSSATIVAPPPSAPSTPALDVSPLFSPSRRLSSSLPTGTRKNLTPDALIPLDAPVQSRNYPTPSATSRRDPSRKRSRTEALADEEEADNGMGELDALAAKRLQNTLAARRSRRRKLEHQLELETNLEREKHMKEQWRSRALTLEALLLSHGISVPPATNY